GLSVARSCPVASVPLGSWVGIVERPGVFDDDRYWVVEVLYAKADPTDLLVTVKVTNAGPESDVLHVLPTVWLRNTWSWDPDAAAPVLTATGDTSVALTHPFLGELELVAGP